MKRHSTNILLCLLLSANVQLVMADDAVTSKSINISAVTTPTTTKTSDTSYFQRIEPKYSEFAGSDENLRSMALGLRTGSSITLTDSPTAGSAGSVTFTPPTNPMGYGNITRTLDFASRDLAAAGITDPTAQQLQAALTGGTVINSQGQVVTMDGVLKLRSEGMGWGKIAHQLGISPAASAQGQQAFLNKNLTNTQSASKSSSSLHTGQGNAVSNDRSGIVNAGGQSVVSASSNKHINSNMSADHQVKSGIVSAGGTNAGYGGITNGNGNGYAGGAASASTHTALGGGNGNALGHSKGKD
jgi:hypothetical protein